MKTRILYSSFVSILTLTTTSLPLATLHAQTTAFTYQGQLSSGTNPANGSFDLKFSVYDANIAGNFIAGPITNSAVAVSGGLFTVTLDFGPGVFTGTNYWVEMSVRTNGAGAFATLVPRQQLTPAPYAISLVAPQATALCPPGSVMAFAGATAPSGWLFCNGTNISRTQFAALFATIGTTYGTGDGSTTFNLPDMRGRAGIGAGQAAGLTNRTLGQALGEETHTLTTNEMPSHSHIVNDPGHTHVASSTATFGTSGSSEFNHYNGGSSGPRSTKSATTGITIQSAGGDAAHNVMQPSLVLNYIIKY